jgi:son of sevenless-like protein
VYFTKNKKLWIDLLEYYDKLLDNEGKKDINIWEDPSIQLTGDDDNQNINENELLSKSTLNQLVARLTPRATVPDFMDIGAFLSTYKTFTTSTNLVRKLIQRYNIPIKLNLSEEEKEHRLMTIEKPIQLRVVRIIKTLIDNHFDELDKPAIRLLKVFLRGLMNHKDTLSTSLVNAFIRKLKPDENPDQIIVSLKNQGGKISTKGIYWKSADKYDILEWPSKDIAEQLTLIEFEYFKNLKPEEFIHLMKLDKQKQSSMEKMIEHFNEISRWVQESILKEEKCKQRAKKMEQFIKIAQKLREINNFETLIAIISSLYDIPIHRLYFTKAEINPKYLKSLEELHQLMDNNYAIYRNALLKAVPPIIPYIGVYRRDLIYYEETQSHGKGIINFAKKKVIFSILNEIAQFQKISYQFKIDINLSAKLRTLPSLPQGMDYDEYKKTILFELSLKREPRNAQKSDIL